jgi:hypothetical protein
VAVDGQQVWRSAVISNDAGRHSTFLNPEFSPADASAAALAWQGDREPPQFPDLTSAMRQRIQFGADPTDYAIKHTSPIFVMRSNDPHPLCCRRRAHPLQSKLL